MASTSRPAAARYGPNGTATRSTLAELGADLAGDALAALACHLADHLDSGNAGSQVAAVSRELRSTLDAVAARNAGPDDALDTFLASLREPK
jgi:hypothetical protein